MQKIAPFIASTRSEKRKSASFNVGKYLHFFPAIQSMTAPPLNKEMESKKGYWTDGEARGLSIAVIADETGTRISLSSGHWYRVQHFELCATSSTDAWRILKTTIKDCGRTLVAATQGEADDHSETENEGELLDLGEHPLLETKANNRYYEIAHLSAKQVDQIYYLIKHALTTANAPFVISHSLRFDTTHATAAPGKRRRRRKKRISKAAQPQWQTVVRNKVVNTTPILDN